MAVPKAKKKKPAQHHRPTKTPFEIVKMTNYLNLAVMIRTLYTVYGWRNKRLGNFIEAYIALLEEVGQGNSVNGLIRDTKDLTGIDVKAFLDEIWGKTHDGQKDY